jgi:hypothetical protein
MGALGTRRNIFFAARALWAVRTLPEIFTGLRGLDAAFLTAAFLRGLDTLARRRLAFSFLPAGLRAVFRRAVADLRRGAVLPFRRRMAFRTLVRRVRLAGRLAARTTRFLAGRFAERLVLPLAALALRLVGFLAARRATFALRLVGFLAMDAAFLRALARLVAGFALRLTERLAPGFLRGTLFLLGLFAVLFFFAIPHPTSVLRLIW